MWRTSVIEQYKDLDKDVKQNVNPMKLMSFLWKPKLCKLVTVL